VCRRNGAWWKQERTVAWGSLIQAFPPRSDVVIDRPNGSGINISW
jgi:hypothetical protein